MSNEKDANANEQGKPLVIADFNHEFGPFRPEIGPPSGYRFEDFWPLHCHVGIVDLLASAPLASKADFRKGLLPAVDSYAYVSRIGHGVSDHVPPMADLVFDGRVLELCPDSWVPRVDATVRDMEEQGIGSLVIQDDMVTSGGSMAQTLRELLERGVKVTVNSDDPKQDE